MAGHSKWANIKHRKERADAKKGKAFTRAAKEIISAVKLAGADPNTNARLRLAIQRAKAVNFPNESIDRNIKRATQADQSDYTQLNYELYGYGGVGLIVEVLTDNKNRISSEMRIATNKCGGTIASPGSVAFNFERKGVIQVAKEEKKEEEFFLAATEAGADDFEIEEQSYLVITPVEALFSVKEALEQRGAKCLEADLQMLPKVWVECDEEAKAANLALIEWLENLDDVDAVAHNMKMG